MTRDLIVILIKLLDEADRAGLRWKELISRKRVFEAPLSERPVPDGLSLRYLQLSAQLMAKSFEDPTVGNEFSRSFLDMIDRAVQKEVGRARILEGRLVSAC